MTVGPATPEYL
jgi:hypothetical protein